MQPLSKREKHRLAQLMERARPDLERQLKADLFDVWLADPADTMPAAQVALLDKLFAVVSRGYSYGGGADSSSD